MQIRVRTETFWPKNPSQLILADDTESSGYHTNKQAGNKDPLQDVDSKAADALRLLARLLGHAAAHDVALSKQTSDLKNSD
jgi:hypothetical protein